MAAGLQPSQSAETFLERLEELPEIKPFPTAATQLMSACQNPDSTSKDIAAIIQCDPGLAMRLLRVANSSMYGFSREIRTIDHAIVVLGFRTVRDLSVSMAGAEVFSQGDSAQAERAALWRHSLACATVARMLAQHVEELNPEEAFLAGIFHDVGKLIFFDLATDDYIALIERTDPRNLIAEEESVFRTTHQEVGQNCADEWGLPEEINSAIGYHHNPEDAPADFELVALIQAANLLANAWQIGVDGEPSIDEAEVLERIELPIDAAVLEQVKENAPAAFEETMQVCTG